MSKNIGILHLSDIHVSEKNKSSIQSLVSLLKTDIERLQSEQDVEIKLICITGDLINSGDKADEELEIALDIFLQPLMDALQIGGDSIFIVAGNHEVKRTAILPYLENGLVSTLTSEDAIDDFLNNIDTESIKRIQYFDHDFALLFGGNPIYQTPLSRAYMLSLNNLNIGIACINSAWRSTGVGNSEKRKMIIGRKQIVGCFDAIKNADLKICLMHHPLDWLVDNDKTTIEKCINKFDIVLNGHIHESDTKMYTTFNGQTLFNTCGKFDNSSDIYNGYSLLSVNPFSKDCVVALRQYLPFPRNCFDEASIVAKDGLFHVCLSHKDDLLALAYNVVHSIDHKFMEYANSYFVSNVASGKVMKSFDESFIIPTFRSHSEYEKETVFDRKSEWDQEQFSAEFICSKSNNIHLLGKKEIGKTTTLHYITKYYLSNFNTLKKVPVILDVKRIDFSGNNVIERAIHRFVNDFCSQTDSYSLLDIDALVRAGLLVIMIDNFEAIEPKQLDKMNEFALRCSNSRFIFAERENISARAFGEVSSALPCECTEVYIQSLTKEQIRAIASKSFISNDDATLVDKVMLCFKKTSLPKTPFVLSLILSLCDNSEFTPINEAVIMEQFMESLLEKSSPSEAYSGTFDFRSKEDFLIFLVMEMHKQNKYFFTEEDFYKILQSYHSSIGFSISETNFDTVFFNNGVLIRTGSIVTFRYTCMIEYYVAKKAKDSDQFLQCIMDSQNYLNYPNELLYYTGLNRRSNDIISIIRTDLRKMFDSLNNNIMHLKEYNINLDFTLPKEEFKETLTDSRMSQCESDNLHDTRDTSDDRLPEQIDKTIQYRDKDAFVKTLSIYGGCLKNLELIPKAEKDALFKDYIYGLCIMLGILKQQTEEYYEAEFIKMESSPELKADEIATKKSIASDIVKVALPLALQSVLLENAGTAKLRSVIKDSIDLSEAEGFPKFFSVFAYCDLRLPGFQGVLQRYVNESHSKTMLKIIFFKLLYYYRCRYFHSTCDIFLENTLADINIKLYGSNKYDKGLIVQSIRENKRFTSA